MVKLVALSKSPNYGRSNYLCCLFKLRSDLFRFGTNLLEIGQSGGDVRSVSLPLQIRFGACGWLDLEDFWLVGAERSEAEWSGAEPSAQNPNPERTIINRNPDI